MENKDEFLEWLEEQFDDARATEMHVYKGIIDQYESFLKSQPAPAISFEGVAESLLNWLKTELNRVEYAKASPGGYMQNDEDDVLNMVIDELEELMEPSVERSFRFEGTAILTSKSKNRVSVADKNNTLDNFDGKLTPGKTYRVTVEEVNDGK